jgi:hypothetical protein
MGVLFGSQTLRSTLGYLDQRLPIPKSKELLSTNPTRSNHPVNPRPFLMARKAFVSVGIKRFPLYL